MIWIKCVIQTMVIVFTIILGMVYGWGLVPKRWSVVIICYLIANGLIPLCGFLNYKLAKKYGWDVPKGYHLHRNPPKGKRKAEGLGDSISKDYRTSSMRGTWPGDNTLGD